MSVTGQSLSGALLVSTMAAVVLGAPPVAGRGYGLPLRTIDGLDDVRAAQVSDDGILTVALGAGGVVRIDREGLRSTVVPWWPAGGIGEAVALGRTVDGRLAVVDAARSAILFSTTDGKQNSVSIRVNDQSVRPVGVAFLDDRMFIADGSLPRVIVSRLDGSNQSVWPIAPSAKSLLQPILGGIAAGGGVVMVTDRAGNRVVALSPDDGRVVAEQGDRGAFPEMWQWPGGIAWDGLSFVVTDTLNHRVVRIDPHCKTLDQWGQHAVRPREGNGKIHYPQLSLPSPDGLTVAVAEPFERRVQLFGGMPEVDPAAARMTPLPSSDGVASHFSTELALNGQTLLVYEPESASALVFDLRTDPPIHITTVGGPGNAPGQFGQVTALCVDEAKNRLYLVDPVRGVISVYAVVRDGTAPHFDPFMGRLLQEASLQAVTDFVMEKKIPGPPRVWPVDFCRTPEGTFIVLDGFGGRIIELDAALRPIAAFGGWEQDGRLLIPTQCALTDGGDVMVVDGAERAVKRYSRADGAFRGVWKLDGSKRPFGIAAVPDVGGVLGRTRFAITDASADELGVLDVTSGNMVLRTGSTGAKPGELWEPAAVDWSPKDGRLYVTDHGNHRIQTFALDGSWQSSFGLGRAWVRPKDPTATAPVNPLGQSPSPVGAADTLKEFPTPVKDGNGWFQAISGGGSWVVRWKFRAQEVAVSKDKADASVPPLRDPFAVDVEVKSVADGKPFVGQLKVDAAMPQHGHGMNVAPKIRSLGLGVFTAEGMLFHMPGYWELYIDLIDPTVPGVLERAQGSVTLP